jgi:ribosome maturation factor RimP
MLTAEIQEAIEHTVTETMPEAFIVTLRLARGRQNVLDLKVDTDAGITMQECANLSRKVGYMLEQREDFDFSYTLQVSSPGVGTPLVMHRQYAKSVGRHLQLLLQDGRSFSGLLTKVDEQGLVLELIPDLPRKGRKKKASPSLPEELTQAFTFAQIKEGKLIVVF